VVALCVLDALGEPEGALAEAAGVLRPGGCFIHLLDLTTNLEWPFRDLAEEWEVPLPNVLAGISLVRKAEAPPLLAAVDPHHDLLMGRYGELRRAVDLLRHARHPLGAALDAYVALFDPEQFDATRAATEFVTLTSEADPRFGVGFQVGLQALLDILAAPRYRELAPLTLRTTSSLDHLRARLRALSAAGPWEVELDELVTRRSTVARDTVAPGGAPASSVRALGRWAGWSCWLDHAPAMQAGLALEALTGSTAPRAPADEPVDPVIVEYGVHALVLRKRGGSSDASPD
jgi:hypothetical protein